MSRVRVVIATTSGPVEVRRITPEHTDVDSAVCIENTDSELPISAAYNSFVRPPTVILQRYFEHDSYRVWSHEPYLVRDHRKEALAGLP